MGEFHKISGKYLPLYLRIFNSIITIKTMPIFSERPLRDVRPNKKYRAWIIAALVIGALSVILETSSTFQECIHDTKNKEGEYAAQKGIAKVAKIYSIRRDCVGAFIHKNGEAIAALFTVVLAFSTIGLWSSTRQLWEVTRIAAEHVRVSERAHIYGGLGGQLIDYSSLDGPQIFANLNNLGKTPAFIVRIAVAVRPYDDLPEEPYYPPGITPGFVLGENEKRFPAHAACAWWGWREGSVFYGRIWFTDVVDRKTQRYSSFILDIDSGYTAVIDRPRYWDIGEEKSAS
jgi:hypothetical protein